MCIRKNITDSDLRNFNDQILRHCREIEILGITLDESLDITLDNNLNFRSHIKKKKIAEKQNKSQVYKIVNGVGQPIMKSLFHFRLNQYNLRNLQEFSTEKKETIMFK